MSRIEFKGGYKVELPIAFFEDGHMVIYKDDQLEIFCPKEHENYNLKSQLGNLDVHCPGCGRYLLTSSIDNKKHKGEKKNNG